MSAAFRRNATITRLLQSHHHPITDPTRARILLRTQTQHSKAYFRVPDFIRRSTREYEHSSSSLFSSRFSSSSSSSSSKIGLVGWYLGSIKSRPVLTKSITSSLIYIAADLSSQVMNSNLKPLYFLFSCASLCLVLEKERKKSRSC